MKKDESYTFDREEKARAPLHNRNENMQRFRIKIQAGSLSAIVIWPVRHLKRCALYLYLVVRYRPHITSTSSSSPPLLSFSPSSFPSYFSNPISTPIHGVASVIGTDDDLAEMLEQATELAQMRCDEQRMNAVRHNMNPRERRWIEEARRRRVCTTDIRRSETEEESQIEA